MSAKNEAIKCSQVVRNIPLERFRLPTDGRKWKQSARSRKAFLQHLSSYANADGTFVRNGRNYSPSLETLQKDFARGSYNAYTTALHVSGLLSWTREHHYERRVYSIHLPNQCQDSSEEQCQDSLKTVSGFVNTAQKQCQDSPEQCQDSSKTVSASVQHPSIPWKKEPSKEERAALPSAPCAMASNETSLSSFSSSNLHSEAEDSGQMGEAEEIESTLSDIKTAAVGCAFSQKGTEILKTALQRVYSENKKHNRFDDEGFLLDPSIIEQIVQSKLKAWAKDEYMLKNFPGLVGGTFYEDYRRERVARREANSKSGNAR